MSGHACADYFTAAFTRMKIMVILRGFPAEETVALCEQAWAAGIQLVEVPIAAEAALPSLRAAVSAARDAGRTVGAGTVITGEQVTAAARAGATFTVAPGLDRDVAAMSLRHGLPHLPGVATVSEIQQARRLGLSWLKAFPAAQLSPGWFSAVREPIPEARLVATGGIGSGNAAQFLAAGAAALAAGSAVARPGELEHLARLGRPG